MADWAKKSEMVLSAVTADTKDTKTWADFLAQNQWVVNPGTHDQKAWFDSMNSKLIVDRLLQDQDKNHLRLLLRFLLDSTVLCSLRYSAIGIDALNQVCSTKEGRHLFCKISASIPLNDILMRHNDQNSPIRGRLTDVTNLLIRIEYGHLRKLQELEQSFAQGWY